MRIRYVALLTGVMVCSLFCTSCSSPYLPHNAFKYIPRFRNSGNAVEEKENNNPKEDLEGDETVMEVKPLKHQAYFSPDSIRDRYAKHVQNESIKSNDPLLDIAQNAIELMRKDGKSKKEIHQELKNKFHFSDETIDSLVGE